MSHIDRISRIISVLLAISLAVSAGAQDVNDEPLEENWAPSEWGPNDKAGAVNRTTPAMILAAIQLVKQGKVATLGKTYADDMPVAFGRSYRLTIPGLPSGDAYGDQLLLYNDEMISGELGQLGTQFDGPGHIGVKTSKGSFFYNGRYLEDSNITGYGLGPLGVEHVAKKGFVCRGVLLDAARWHGGPLPVPTTRKRSDPGIVSDTDIRAIVKAQGIDPIGEGDCVFLYTGHGDLWHPSNWESYDAAEKARRTAIFNAGEPGFGISGCEYLASRNVILTGADSWSVEAVGPDFAGENSQPFECHLRLQTKRGIWNIENLDLSQLVADKAYEFLFVWSPLKLRGATGSPGNPVAIY